MSFSCSFWSVAPHCCDALFSFVCSSSASLFLRLSLTTTIPPSSPSMASPYLLFFSTSLCPKDTHRVGEGSFSFVLCFPLCCVYRRLSWPSRCAGIPIRTYFRLPVDVFFFLSVCFGSSFDLTSVVVVVVSVVRLFCFVLLLSLFCSVVVAVVRLVSLWCAMCWAAPCCCALGFVLVAVISLYFTSLCCG